MTFNDLPMIAHNVHRKFYQNKYTREIRVEIPKFSAFLELFM